MRILLTKRSDERHGFAIVRADASRESVELETRSTLHHDLTHLAVEEAAGLDEGFFGSLAAGASIEELSGRMPGSGAPYSEKRMEIERGVALLQRMAKGDVDPARLHAHIVDMLAAQDAEPPPWFTRALVMDVHARLRALVGRWKATPYGGTLELAWHSKVDLRADTGA
jgi:hypothetical protein